MSTFETISQALSERFVRSEEIARAIALAISSGKNLLLWGPGGHGKSEMVTRALSVVTTEDCTFVQSFGEGMDEATLWGGLDFRALEDEKVLRYHPENSFLAKEFAVFEELFDAPASVLLALKDTLTARKLRKGAQTFAMRTKVIIAVTNKDPAEVSELGPAAAALVERFPLQLKVEWPSYSSADYLELFEKVGPQLPGANLNGSVGALAEIFEAVSSVEEMLVSPRTAVHALGVVKAAAAMRGSNRVEQQDLVDLAYLPGMQPLAQGIREDIAEAYEAAAAESRLVEAERELVQLDHRLEATDTPIKALKVAKQLISFQDEIAALTVTDDLVDRRRRLRDAVGEKIMRAQERALETTRI